MNVPCVLSPGAKLPSKAHPADAGHDLCTTSFKVLSVGEVALLPTGVRLSVPEGHVGMIKGRSGLGSRGVGILAGVVDPGYSGEVKVVVVNHSSSPVTMEAGSKVAQILFIPVVDARCVEAESLGADAPRGESGFGSSGA